MREILAELDVVDEEHPDTWLTHESGWILSAYESGLLVLVDPDQNQAHLTSVAPARVLELWLMLADGRIDDLRAFPWIPGLPKPDPAEPTRARAEAVALTEQLDRRFCAELGPESLTQRCAADGCSRGRVALSVHCRAHHFEAVRKRPAPIDA